MIHPTSGKALWPLILCAVCLIPLLPLSASAQVNIFPGQNIQQVVNGHPAGTLFYLKAGVHRMQSVTPRNGDMFYGEAGTVLSGARQLSGFTRVGSYWSIGSQTQEGPVNYSQCKPDFPRCLHPENLYFNSVPLKHVDAIGQVGPGTWFFDYAADRIYFWDDPTNQNVEISVTPVAFSGYATNVTIHGLVIEKYATPVGDAAVAVGTGWRLQYCEVRLNHSAGVSMYTNSTLWWNWIHHNAQFGVTGVGNNMLVEGNEIAYNNFGGWFNPYWGAGGTKWVLTVSLTVRNNFSHHNGGPGFHTDIDNIYTLYEGNRVEDNERGIYHEISYDAVIRNNTSRRNGAQKPYPWWSTGAGIEISGSANVEVYGNTVEDNWQGITGLDDHRGSGRYGLYALRNLNVHDNVIISRITDPGGGRTGVIDMDNWTAFTSGNNRFHSNQYQLPNDTGRYFMWFGERTRSEWQSYGQDLNSWFGAGPTVITRYLSDNNWSYMTNGWGPAERDRSNGEFAGGDGRPMSIDGVSYPKGIGAHSDSDLRYALNGRCIAFSAVVGIDDEVGANGSVGFQVYVDGGLRYDSGRVTSATPAKVVSVDVTGGSELRLVVNNGGDNPYFDHADWADAKVSCQ